MSGLPSGWVEAPIGELCGLKNGRAFKPTDWTTSGVPIVRIQNLNNSEAKFNFYAGEVEDRFRLRGGELLFAWSGTPGTSFGAHVWNGGDAVLNQHIFRVDFDTSKINKRFFRFAINQKLDELIGIAHGGAGLQHVTKGKFEGTEIWLPPLPEQTRIADKLDALLARVDAARERLNRVPALLKRFRQSVLAAATSGELTEDWRGGRDECVSHPDVHEEHGAWQCDDLPGSWRWMPFALAFDDNTNSKRKLPQSAYDDKGELAVIDQGESLIGGYTNRTELCSDAPIPAIVFGDHTRCVKYIDFPFVQGADGVKVLNPTDALTAKFAYHALHAIELPDKGYSRHSKFLRASYFPIPPLAEQHEIIRRVEALFALADKVQSQYETARARVDKLTPALLAKAFRGEMVPQDPNDEPASALLERLRAGKPGKPGKRQR